MEISWKEYTVTFHRKHTYYDNILWSDSSELMLG